MPRSAPPLPGTPDPFWEGFRTHLLAFIYLAPSISIGAFAWNFVMPRARLIWQDAGLNGSRANWLMENTERTLPYLLFFALGFFGFVVAAEISWHNWRRYRRTVVTLFMLLVHTAVLVWITSLAVCTGLAGPALAHKKLREFKAKMEQTSGNAPQPPTR